MYTRFQDTARRGAVVVYALVAFPVLLAFTALSVDLGVLYAARAESQSSADAAALAGAGRLLDERRLLGSATLAEVHRQSREEAASYAALNTVRNEAPFVDQNVANDVNGDMVLGILRDFDNYSEPMSFTVPSEFNAVRVRVRRDEIRNGPVQLYFARILGIGAKDVVAEATAAVKDGVIGYKVTEQTGNADLLPFALHIDSWNALLSGSFTTGDNYAVDPATLAVSPGSDGKLELNLYPGGGTNQLPPGNFGTVDIGGHSNSSADIERQILYGVNADDLAYFGGELKLGADGTLPLQGDTGLSAGFKDALAAIKGQPRAIPLFSEVESPGNNAVYTIVGFAGIRIVNVKLTGAMKKKELVIQPAIVADDATITTTEWGSSYFVYHPPRLVR